MNRRFAAVAVIPLLLASPVAHAGESEHERATRLFNEARKLIEVDECAAAVPKLEESIAHEPSIGARFSLADCIRERDPIGAFWHFREAALLAFLKHDDRLAGAEERALALVARTGGVRFDVDAVDLRAPGFDVRVDDRLIDRFHLSGPIALPPGEHRIVATVADGRRFEETARITTGTIAASRIVLGRSPAIANAGDRPPAPAVVVPSSTAPLVDEGNALSGRRKIALVAGGAGIAALSVATAFGVVALEKQSELDRACNGDRNACTGDPRAVDPVLDSGDKNATISTILFAAGGALLAGGIVLWLTDSKTSPKHTAVLRW